MRTRLVIFLALVLTGPACKQAAEPRNSHPAPQAATPWKIPASVSAERRTPIVIAVHNVLPAVVNIQTESRMKQRQVDPWFGFFGPPREYRSQSLGSGFVWSEGVVVTNAHVIEGASRVTVVFQDGRQEEARVVGADPDNDLAVLRVEADGLQPAALGTSADLLIGEPVIAVGNPFGLSGTVTTGVVSATGRSVPSREQDRTFTDFIQTDASINPGNSGGPLLNIEGKVIGINVAIYAEAQGIGFAIPVDRAKKIVDDLLRYGEVRSAWVGVITTTLTPEESQRLGLAANRGALVTRVFGDSPASRAGLAPGDVITAVEATPIESREAFTTFTATAEAGRRVSMKVMREDKQLTIAVAPIKPPADLGLQILEAVCGIEVADEDRGVTVTAISRGSRAQRIGLEPGDRIVGVGGTEVSSTKELNELVARSSDRSSLVLYVARGRYIYTLTFPMGL